MVGGIGAILGAALIRLLRRAESDLVPPISGQLAMLLSDKPGGVAEWLRAAVLKAAQDEIHCVWGPGREGVARAQICCPDSWTRPLPAYGRRGHGMTPDGGKWR